MLFIRNSLFLLLFCLILFSCKNKEAKVVEEQTKPNILLINIDDLGWKDLSFMGNDFFETPNIDALSKEGIIFTNGYATAANCAPSRANLMTGQFPQRHGIYTVGNSDRGKAKDRKLIPTKNITTLRDSFLTLPEVLKNNGYSTCHAGKWHLTDNPLDNGFDINIGGNHAGHPSSYYPPYKNVDLEAEEGKRLTDLIMDKTIDFLRTAEKPFFINYSPYAVHTPIQPVKELVGKYKNKTSEQGHDNANYATMIENMDVNIGRLVTALKEQGKLKNTFIVFTSDNGGLYAVSKQHPLRSGKGSYYEGGIRVPFFFVRPGYIKENQQSDEPITNLDLYPTILEVANIKKPEDKILDGNSLATILTQEKTTLDRPLFWHFPIYLQAVAKVNENRDAKFRTRPGSVIRKGNWKLHHYFEDNGMELYNLQDDLGEKNNLAEKEPEKTKELLNLLDNWRQKTDAPVPIELNPEYKGEN
ncbi:sulfatase [Aureibaculum sp. 2210JD6-5]|uniref:sulfatase n=1 Tax=Aureibaculum sp. 2210JD6-5 TaxID=3103957 RepID=UPI002AAED42E|nr:sulfatase [Aureibaculum sp. 2210JD6-5]MDY7396044.1 sulfatase [Aureibaculum sp. 2210JD6-5]